MGVELLLSLALMVLGFVLIGVEVAVVPGFGVPGVLGLVGLVAGVVGLWQAGGALMGLVGAAVGLAVTIGAVTWFVRSGTGRSLVLRNEVSGQATEAGGLGAQVGRRATAASALRPSGVVEVEGERYDAMLQDGYFVPAGTVVKVVGHGHGQLHVESLDEDAEAVG